MDLLWDEHLGIMSQQRSIYLPNSCDPQMPKAIMASHCSCQLMFITWSLNLKAEKKVPLAPVALEVTTVCEVAAVSEDLAVWRGQPLWIIKNSPNLNLEGG